MNRAHSLFVCTLVLCVWALAGCDGSTTEAESPGEVPTPDGGPPPEDPMAVPFEGDVTPATPAAPALPAEAPAAPAPPDFAGCPEGWRAVADEAGGYTTCAPFPADEPEACAAGLAHFVGAAGCQPIGRPCPDGAWPEGLEGLEQPIVYVDDDGPLVGGGRTPERALRTLAAGLAAAEAGGLVVVAKGTYNEVVTVPDGVTVRGACAAETLIAPSLPFGRALDEGVLTLAEGATGGLEDVTVTTSAPLAGVVVPAGATLDVQGVEVRQTSNAGVIVGMTGALNAAGLLISDIRRAEDGTEGFGLLAGLDAQVALSRSVVRGASAVGLGLGGSRATLVDVAVRGTREAGGEGIGVLITGGATVDATRLVCDDNQSAGIVAAEAGTALTLTDGVVSRTQGRESNAGFGRGLYVFEGAQATVTRGSFIANHGAGVTARGEGVSVSLTDVAVLDTRPAAEGYYGRGLEADTGARAEVTRGVFDRNNDAGVIADDPGTEVTLADVLIARTASGPLRPDGVGGLQVTNGARLTATRALIDGNDDTGVTAQGRGSLAALEDITISNTQAGPEDQGEGVMVDLGARVELTRATIESSRHHGVFVVTSDCSVALTDVSILGTQPAEAGRGWGLRVQDGGRADGERVLIDGSHELGMFLRGSDTVVQLSDLTVRNTATNERDTWGAGLLAFSRAQAELERAAFEQNHYVGLLAFDNETRLTLTDVAVRGTRPILGTFGWGVAAQEGATLSIERGEITDSTDVGVMIYDGAMTLRDTRVNGIAEMPCQADGSCPEWATWRSGSGVVILNEGTLASERLRVEDAALCGMLAGSNDGGSTEGMAFDLVETGIFDSAIGFCSQVDDLGDPSFLSDPDSNEIRVQQTDFITPVAAPNI